MARQTYSHGFQILQVRERETNSKNDDHRHDIAFGLTTTSYTTTAVSIRITPPSSSLWLSQTVHNNMPKRQNEYGHLSKEQYNSLEESSSGQQSVSFGFDRASDKVLMDRKIVVAAKMM